MSNIGSRLPFGAALALGLAFGVRGGLAQVENRAATATPPVLVVFELVVEDTRGRPVTDLRVEEVEVSQDATRQKVRTFRVAPQPGLYEISYAPLSGQAGGVSVRVTRRGAVARGPNGPSLKPRVVSALSPLEAELTRLLKVRRGAADLACHVAVLRFEPIATGVRHSVAVEIPLSEIRFERGSAGLRGRLQVLARFHAVADPTVGQNVTLDQVVEAATESAIAIQRLVWTGTVVIGPGRHTIEILVRDPGTERVTTRALAVEVPPRADGLRLSSVVLLRPRSFFFLRDQAEGDDPLVYEGAPLMPTLQPTVTARRESSVRFFVALYTTTASPEPVTLKAELLRDGTKVGEGPVALPKPDPSGEIRYLGMLPTGSFRAGSYVLRLVAQQGASTAADEASFVLTSEEPAIPLIPR